MKEKITMFIYFVIFIPVAKGAVPGTFFWKPRLGLDLRITTTEKPELVLQPTKENIQSGRVVLIDGYQVAMAALVIAVGMSSMEASAHLNPVSAFYYTNVYRWALRHLDLIPTWIAGIGDNYCDTHKVWQRRFYYMNEFVPRWLRPLFFYVNKKGWAKEEKQFKRFQKYALAAYGKHYRYPNKEYNDFKSQETDETFENFFISSESFYKS